jgi:hypothetical protein
MGSFGSTSAVLVPETRVRLSGNALEMKGAPAGEMDCG